MLNLLGLRLRRLILHEVPASSARDPQVALRLTDGIVDLTGDDRRYVRERLVKDLANDAREVIEDAEADSPVPGEIRTYLAGQRSETAFITMSQVLAQHLRDVQTGVNSPGVVLVADCTLDRSPSVLIAKVELEKGIQATPVARDGHLLYDMRLLEDLVFGQTSRIFKVGLFTGLGRNQKLLVGHAIDRQMSGPDMASFFLSKYLGCEYTQRPEVLTQRFHDQAEAWFNANVKDPEQRTRYEVALLAEMGNKNREVVPDQFAATFLDPQHRDAFRREVVAQQAEARWPKDTQLVRIKRVKIETRDGIMVLVDPEQVESHIEVEPESLTVRDQVTKVTGSGRARRRLLGDAG